MKRVDQIISLVREQTENEDATSTSGISDEEFIQALNDAQERLQDRILTEYPDITFFDASTTTSIVTNVRAYPIGSSTVRPILSGAISLVEYRQDSLEESYFQLERRELDELSLVRCDIPSAYTSRGSNILIGPIPSSSIGNLRVTFAREVNSLDKRRAKVASTANNGTSYTTITLDSDPEPDEILDDMDYFICINSAYGDVEYYNIPVSEYDVATRIMTLDSDVLLSAGTISPGDWVTFGKWTTTHSELPSKCEKYLKAYCKWIILRRDSSNDAVEQNEELAAMEVQLVSMFKKMDRDRKRLPIDYSSPYTI